MFSKPISASPTGKSHTINSSYQIRFFRIVENLYVNGEYRDDSAIGKLMHDLHCKKADEMHSPILAKRVYELKETQKGVELMCHEMEKIYSEGMESGEKRGELKKAKETALSMAEEGMDVKMIARLVKVSEKDVQKWIDENV